MDTEIATPYLVAPTHYIYIHPKWLTTRPRQHDCPFGCSGSHSMLVYSLYLMNKTMGIRLWPWPLSAMTSAARDDCEGESDEYCRHDHVAENPTRCFKVNFREISYLGSTKVASEYQTRSQKNGTSPQAGPLLKSRGSTPFPFLVVRK